MVENPQRKLGQTFRARGVETQIRSSNVMDLDRLRFLHASTSWFLSSSPLLVRTLYDDTLTNGLSSIDDLDNANISKVYFFERSLLVNAWYSVNNSHMETERLSYT